MGVRTAIYLRISRDEEKKGKGVDRQLAKCREQLVKLGWDEAEVFNENDTSATRRKPRPLYEAMLGKIRAGEFDAVIGYAQDRMTRKPEEAEAILRLVDDQGLRVATSAAGELGLVGDPDARAAFRNSTVGAAREVEWIKKRVSDKCAQRAGEGMPQGMVPFGWDAEIELDGKGRFLSSWYVLNEAEAELIRDSTKALLGGESLRSVTARANLGDVHPMRGGKWTSHQLKAVLVRPSNARIRMYKGTVAAEGDDVQWPEIITPAQHRALLALFADPSRTTNYRGYKPKWLLSGIAVCGHCGNTKINVVTGGNRGRTPAYTCVGTKPSACFARTWTSHADTYVAALITDKLADPKLGDPMPDVQDRITELGRKRAVLDAELNEIAEDDDYTLGQKKIMTRKRKEQIAQINAEESALLPKVAQLLDLEAEWSTGEIERQRSVVRSMIERIELAPTTKGKARVFTPDQIRIKWNGES